MIIPYLIEPLNKTHDRHSFDCGEESLNVFLKRYARQNEEKGLSRTYVAVKKDKPKICGYYTISSGSVSFENVPDNLPQYPIPVVHLGRLAVDQSAKGHGLGKALLANALKRTAKISGELGIFAVEVYALNEQARKFYLKFGLTELKDDKLHLYITLKKIKKLVK